MIWNWWRQAMTRSAKAQYDCIKAFSETEDMSRLDRKALNGAMRQYRPMNCGFGGATGCASLQLAGPLEPNPKRVPWRVFPIESR